MIVFGIVLPVKFKTKCVWIACRQNRHIFNGWFDQNIINIMPYPKTGLNRLDKATPFIHSQFYEQDKVKQRALVASLYKLLNIHQRKQPCMLHVFWLPLFLWVKKWKVFLLKKDKKDHTNPASYRLITLLEPFAKLLEKILVYELSNRTDGR